MKSNSDAEKTETSESENSPSASETSLLNSTQSTSTTIGKKLKKKSVRCQECRKKLSLACRYECRCGRVFCSVHRYAETHKCTFDYKEEGRRLIKEANPLIVAEKVTQI